MMTMRQPNSATWSRACVYDGAGDARRLGRWRDAGAFASTTARGVTGGGCTQPSITRAGFVACYLTNWNAATHAWDGFDQLETVQGTGILRYNGYSAEGERVLMRDQNIATITLRGLDNKVLRDITYDPTAAAGQQWRWSKDYVYRDGSLLASVSATDGIRHYTLDHLGSPRLLTDRCGERKKLFTYLPFGQEVPQPSASNPQDKERMRFTVHERDLGLLDTGADDLDYMHARTYGPSVGRFLSTDPVTGRPESPQSWNLFTYANNNPITTLDQDGRLAPPWHFFITLFAAHHVGFSWRQSFSLAWKNMAVDFRKGSQSTDASATVLHDMRGLLPNGKYQTAEEARQATRDRIAADVRTNTNDSLAEAGHMGIDSQTPMHDGHTWQGMKLNLTTAAHIVGDWLPSPKTVSNAYHAVVDILDRAKSQPFQLQLSAAPKLQCSPTVCGDGTSDAHFTFQMEKGRVTNQ